MIALWWLWPDYRQLLQEAWEVLRSDNESRIRDWVSQFGAWGPALIIGLMVVQMFLLVVPSWLLMVIAVLAYGPVKGALIAIVAVITASSIGYALGRFLGDSALHRLLGEEKERAVRRETDRYGFWAVIVARINPMLSNDAISLVGGMVAMRFWHFLLATLAGITPLTIAIAITGEGWQEMKSGLVVLSLISLLALGVKIWWDHRRGAGSTR